ncbi:CapA family protein [Micrococcus sp.]|uniref:CapA family protein n=1 Tax=Micrococcus sp. TaxID=1271 RepID=UPI002A911466|nr:CapA family protein [Micrococcus sp.]MDY6055416.1 CapA family protein [Micrococcus sp.]
MALPLTHTRRSAVFAATALLLAGCTAAPMQDDPAATGPTMPQSSASGEPTAAPSSTPSTPSRTLSVNTSGDILWRPGLYEPAQQPDGSYDFLPQIESLTPFVQQADLAICHHEVVIQADGGPYTGYPRFRSPKESVDALAEVGFDACTTASNHTNDGGFAGLVRTLDTLEAAGLETAGTWRSREEAQMPDLMTTEQGVVVGIVSQTYALNGIPSEPGTEWSVDLLDPDKAIADAKKAREAGADVVIYHMHAGDEYTHIPNAEQEEVATRVATSGAVDLIIGQHPHWVQPIDRIAGVWVIYSTGNLMTSMEGETPGTHDGAMVQVDFTETPEGGFEVSDLTWAPTYIVTRWNDPTGATDPRVLLIPDELADPKKAATMDPDLRARLEASAARTREVITRRISQGLTERTAADVRAGRTQG